MPQTHDILILGAGFGGSLLATILAKSGLTVALVDRNTHPRFVIGESSTPLADQTLADLAETYNIPEFLPLTKYGTWKERHPELTCGPKRGFSYFGHQADTAFNPNQQLLVSASDSQPEADTHWLRSDVDEFFFQIAERYAVDTFTPADYSLQQTGGNWTCDGSTPSTAFRLQAPFAVDATGSSAEVLNLLQIGDLTEELITNSSATFAHFSNVSPFSEILAGQSISTTNHPFPCDQAAVHHILSNAWMWQLPFDDNTTSIGIMSRTPIESTAKTEECWQSTINAYPLLQQQFAKANIVRPEAGLVATKRIQRLRSQAAADNWAALPSTVGFIDPLHSTGIAHTLFGIRRLSKILTTPVTDPNFCRSGALANYSNQLISELRHIDTLIEGCYAALPNFRLFANWCIIYFAAVTSDEQIIFDNANQRTSQSFLRTTDAPFKELVQTARQQLQVCLLNGSTPQACDNFEAWLRNAIQPWNQFNFLSNPLPSFHNASPGAPAGEGVVG